MAQYKTGTVSVTNGDATVTGSGTLWTANVNPGDGFTVAGTGVPYTVASVTNDTSLELSAPYAGATASGQSYAIYRDFTTNENLPELSQGDIETATIWTRALRIIDGLLGAATTTSKGTVEKATTAEAEAGAADKFPDAAGVHSAFNQYGLGSGVSSTEVDADLYLTAGGFISPSSGHVNFPPSGNNVRAIVTVVGGSYIEQVVQQVFAPYRRFSRAALSSDIPTTPWREIYHQGSILGTVSQSGGVPTGAIIERGSNANGEYVKFADGTMIAFITYDCDIGNNSLGAQAFPFPVAFAALPAHASVSTAVTGAGSYAAKAAASLKVRGDSASEGQIAPEFESTALQAGTLTVYGTFFGRWF